MKQKLLQTWARKSAKLLAAFALLATTAGVASATDAVLDSNDYSSDYTFGTKKIGEITFTATNNGSGNGVKYFNSTSSFRIYGGASLNMAASEGYVITKVVIARGDGNKNNQTWVTGVSSTPAGFNSDTDTWTGSSQNVSIKNGGSSGHTRFTKVTVSYDVATPEDPNKPDTPTLSIDGGKVAYNSSVTISGDTKTKKLKYWFDDNDASATTVTGTSAIVTITEACTLHAIAIGEGGVESSEKSASYTIDPASYPNTIYYNECTAENNGFVKSPDADSNPWIIDPQYGLKATGYKGGQNTATEGVIASPVIDLTNRTNIILDFDQAVNQFRGTNGILSGNAMVAILEDISVVIAEIATDEMPTEWTPLTETAITLPESQSWNFYAQNPAMSLDAYKGKKVRIGFKYTSTTQRAGTWEIKNVLVKGDEVPELPAPTFEDGDQDVLVNEVDGGWSIRPEKYPVTLTFAVADGVQMYAKAVNAAQAAAEGDNDGYSALEGNALKLTKTGEVYSVYAMKDGVKSEVKTVTADVPSGISSIEAENGEAVYFNLQGVRVENPTQGIFIRVQNGKAVKIAK